MTRCSSSSARFTVQFCVQLLLMFLKLLNILAAYGITSHKSFTLSVLLIVLVKRWMIRCCELWGGFFFCPFRNLINGSSISSAKRGNKGSTDDDSSIVLCSGSLLKSNLLIEQPGSMCSVLKAHSFLQSLSDTRGLRVFLLDCPRPSNPTSGHAGPITAPSQLGSTKMGVLNV